MRIQEIQGLVKGLNESSSALASMADQEQSERNEFKDFVKSQAGGDWDKGAKMYAQLKGRYKDDIFGDAVRQDQFMQMKFDFDTFTKKDWDNYWLMAQHCDHNRNFQKQALATITKYLGKDHKHYKYLTDRISCGASGTQRYGTQHICKKDVQQNVKENVDNKPSIGINVRSDGNTDYASLIVDGKKKYESRKTDSLRPYVGKTVGIVRTGNGPAVAIGQVTIGEPIVVDAAKFDKLRKQHLVPQGSLFDIGPNDTKYLYPMINPIRWNEEKLIKNKGIVARKIQEQELTEFDYNQHVKMLNDYMQKLGYSYIGHGTDAHVFAKEEGPVVKVLIPENGDITTAKNPFLAFLNYCEKNANNPYLPKFIETTKQPIQLGAEKFDQVVMERLEELDPDYDEMIMDMIESIEQGQPLDPQYKPYAKFYQTLKSVIQTGRKLGFSNDIIAFDYSNVMQRGNTPVIADPWVAAGLK
jgi:hypothetical protein